MILLILSISYLIFLFFLFRARQKHKQKEELKQQNKYEYRTYSKEQLGSYTDKRHNIPADKDIWGKQPITPQTSRLNKPDQDTFSPIYSKRNKKKTSRLHSGETYHMDYIDGSGEITSRTVTINKIYLKNGTTYIKAFCHLRNEERTFKLERIIGHIIDISTGELLDPNELNLLKR